MKLTDDLIEYAGKCADLSLLMNTVKDGNNYFYNEFPRLIVKNGYFDGMIQFISSHDDLTSSDVIEEFNRLISGGQDV